MLKSIIVGQTPELMARLRQMCAALDIVTSKTVDTMGPIEPVVRLVNSYRADILFLELSSENLAAAIDLTRRLQANRVETIVVGFAHEPVAEERTALEAGIWQVLVQPFNEKDFLETIRRALDQKKSESSVHAFLPAKGGAGATVTALNTATCLARVLDRRVLLIEADFYSGILPLLLKFTPQASVMDALVAVQRLDERSWGSMVSQRHGIDILAAWGPRATAQESQLSFEELLGFAKQRYDVVIVDLPVIVDQITEAVAYHAKNIFVVSTPEPICMDVARRRLRQLDAHGVRSTVRRAILNRVLEHPSEVDVEEHERTIGGKIAAVLPNDYDGVQAAIAEEGPVNLESLLGRAYLALAGSLAGQEMPMPPPAVRVTGLRSLVQRLTGD